MAEEGWKDQPKRSIVVKENVKEASKDIAEQVLAPVFIAGYTLGIILLSAMGFLVLFGFFFLVSKLTGG